MLCRNAAGRYFYIKITCIGSDNDRGRFVDNGVGRDPIFTSFTEATPGGAIKIMHTIGIGVVDQCPTLGYNGIHLKRIDTGNDQNALGTFELQYRSGVEVLGVVTDLDLRHQRLGNKEYKEQGQY